MTSAEFTYLNSHANSNENQCSLNIVCPLYPVHDPLPSAVDDFLSLFLVDRLVVFQRAHTSKLLLTTGEVQELTVRGVEQSHTQWDCDGHLLMLAKIHIHVVV